MYYKGLKLHVKHLHPANSTRKERHGSKYLTVCKVITPAGVELTKTFSQCSKIDVPSRKKGFRIATDRAKSVVDFLEPMM